MNLFSREGRGGKGILWEMHKWQASLYSLCVPPHIKNIVIIIFIVMFHSSQAPLIRNNTS